jgi:hypothetical protein
MSGFDDDIAEPTSVALTLAAWKADLLQRSARIMLIFELADSNIDFTGLQQEAELFIRVTRIAASIERKAG